MVGKVNVAAWRAFDLPFQPWMRSRMRMRLGGSVQQWPSGPVMLVSNHTSWWDGFFLRRIQRDIRPHSPLYTIALERELSRHPILRVIGGVGITPSSPGSILRAIRDLTERCVDCADSVIGYFPQGRIAPSFCRPLDFTRGVEVFARRLGPITVVPVAIHIEPLTAAAPTAFVLLGSPQRSDTVGFGAVSLERDVTQLLDASMAIMARHGEDAEHVWLAAHTKTTSNFAADCAATGVRMQHV